MSVSDAFKAAVFAQETGEAFLILLTVDHDDLDAPLRFSSDGVDTTSNGNVYYAYPFTFTLPPMADEKPPFANLVIDNVSREIVSAIRGLSSAPTISAIGVLASDPDEIEVQLPDFKLARVTYDRLIVSGTLLVDSLMNEPFPAHSFMPSNFPGLFAGVA